MEYNIKQIISNWLRASENLHFDIKTPFVLEDKNNKKYNCFGFVPKFGSKKGTIILLIKPPKFRIRLKVNKIAEQLGYYCSNLNIECELEYDKVRFIDTLNDWGYFGKESLKPDWCTNKPWGN